ncbi:MAG TPA: glycosyltransferase [Blastocatellia bacterium]|nr:glycosyltransferase [Blastocatellia bacterium]
MRSNRQGDRRKERFHVCLIGTYPPRQCGIATFTADLCQALMQVDADVQASVIAITNPPLMSEHPSEVVFEIRQHQLTDYRQAAEYINLSGAEVVCLQHEYGIFGGPAGRYILELLDCLRKPVVTTLHTVLREPEPLYREVLIHLAALSDHLVVMNSKAIPILQHVYDISPEKVSLIHHGVPDVPFIDSNFYKDKFGVEGRFVILTFGLLSRNKGIELMLEALPEVVRAHPEVVYIVLGATHPEVKRQQGEEYRLWLRRRVRELGLEDYVLFHDRYVEFDQLCEFIGACDIYVTPYQSREQIVSGTLAYAVGMGKAVVSTPYLYAQELLADGRGRLVPYGDPRTLAQTLIELIENRAARHQMRKRAYQFGRDMIWTEVAKRYRQLFDQVVASYQPKSLTVTMKALSGVEYELPEIKLDHLIRLTDDTGLIQHATYGIPNRLLGYSTDDQGRALVVTLRHYQQFGDERAIDLATRYLSFLQYAQRPDGQFHNFLDYTRHFLDDRGSEDTQGRALWGLGAAVALAPREGMRALARDLFERSIEGLTLHHPRALAYAVCGLGYYLQHYDGAAATRRKLNELAAQILAWYDRYADDTWQWFCDELTYANAKIPHALLVAYRVTGDQRLKQVALRTLDFLLAETYQDDHFDFIGNQGWYRRGGERPLFSQQPIEAGYTAEACMAAYDITGDERYLELARAAAEWLLGRNRLGARLYDLTTGACADGLEMHGPSLNQGAESAIGCMLALLEVSEQRTEQVELKQATSATVSL